MFVSAEGIYLENDTRVFFLSDRAFNVFITDEIVFLGEFSCKGMSKGETEYASRLPKFA